MKNYNIVQGVLIILLFWNIQFSKAQTKHNIQVSNSEFSPSLLTIEDGDTIVWSNSAGFHNVNGQNSTYPNNPTSFGNSLGTGWTYSFVFTTTGTYDYRCDAHFSSGMTGKVIVNNTSYVETKYNKNKSTLFYPNPFTKELMLNINGLQISNINIYSSIGSLVYSRRVDSNNLVLDLEMIPVGIYIINLTSDNDILYSRKLFKE
ncbi:MAG: hypothetical protein A2033_15320 [Bacteroidetes bacterium GWA2_31_9]|nr:MAG: hypothetical protein A2033_15320 [Bacteroidetes bacterium GWA2_31_9]